LKRKGRNQIASAPIPISRTSVTPMLRTLIPSTGSMAQSKARESEGRNIATARKAKPPVAIRAICSLSAENRNRLARDAPTAPQIIIQSGTCKVAERSDMVRYHGKRNRHEFITGIQYKEYTRLCQTRRCFIIERINGSEAFCSRHE